MQNEQQPRATLALSLALQHPALSSDPLVLCAAAPACKAWREAVQQCSSCNTGVALHLGKKLLQWSSFAVWLRKHAALVRSMTFVGDAAADQVEEDRNAYGHNYGYGHADYAGGYAGDDMIHGLPRETHHRIAHQLLQQAMELATFLPAAVAEPQAAAAADPAAAAASGQACQQQRLRCTSFSCSCVAEPGALALLTALPAHSLTHLDLSLAFSRCPGAITQPKDIPAVAPVLLRLSSLQQLRLSTFLAPYGHRTGYFKEPGPLGMLAALPAHSLTRLDLTIQLQRNDSVELSAYLGRLRNLQELRLSCDAKHEAGYADMGSSLSALGQLTRLTSLELDMGLQGGYHIQVEMLLQQLLEQPPPLRKLHVLGLREVMYTADWSVLGQLQDLAVVGSDLNCSVLPSSLQQLQLEAYNSAESLSAILPLKQLQRLRLHLGSTEQQQLQQLAQLPALQHLTLCYDQARVASQAACVWPQLSQLQDLMLDFRYDSIEWHTQHNTAELLTHVARCTGLTRLMLAAFQHRSAEGGQVCPIAACSMLSGLSQLKDLCIHGKSLLVAEDAQALSVLTALTRLVLADSGTGVGDVPATAIACSLKQLRHLDLQRCELGSMRCLAVVGRLTKLTELRLEGNSGLTYDGLMLLTGLKQLQQLGASCDDDGEYSAKVDEEDVQNFWAAMRKQQL